MPERPEQDLKKAITAGKTSREQLASLEALAAPEKEALLSDLADYQLRQENRAQITDDQIDAYVDGRASDTDREIIEGEAELDSSLRSLIAAARTARLEAEMTAVPLPQEKKAGFFALLTRARYRIAIEAIGAVGLAGLFAVVFIQMSPQGVTTVPGPVSVVHEPGKTIFKPDPGTLAQLDKANKALAEALKNNHSEEAKKLAAQVKELQQKAETNQESQVLASLETFHVPDDVAYSARLALKSRGEHTEERLLSPVLTTVPNSRPTLTWQPVKDLKSYTVTITEYGKPISGGVLSSKTSSLEVPANLVKPGHTYAWKVVANTEPKAELLTPGGVEATFRVAGTDDARSLESLLKAAGKSHLDRALAYLRFGMLDEAGAEFAALDREKGHSALTRKLLQRFQAEREALLKKVPKKS